MRGDLQVDRMALTLGRHGVTPLKPLELQGALFSADLICRSWLLGVRERDHARTIQRGVTGQCASIRGRSPGVNWILCRG